MQAELISYESRAIDHHNHHQHHLHHQQRSVSMMPSIGGSNHLSLDSTSTSTSLSGAISNLSIVDEQPPALPPKRARQATNGGGSGGRGSGGDNDGRPFVHSSTYSSTTSGSPPQSPRIVIGDKDMSPTPLIKNISSLFPVICDIGPGNDSAGCDGMGRNSKDGYDRDDQDDDEDVHNGDPYSSRCGPNSSQLYKQLSQSSTERRERLNSGEEADEDGRGEVVLRRNVGRKDANVKNLLEETDVLKYLVLKKDAEDGPDIKGGHLDALIIHATKAKVEKITENAFGEAFITTFRTFITPLELLKKLAYRYEYFHCQVTDQKQRAAKEVFSLLVRVVNDLTMPDIDQFCLNLLMDFVYQLICNGNLSMAKLLRVQIMNKVRLYQSSVVSHNFPLSARGVTTNPPTLLDLKSTEIAEQMTLLDSDLFQKIEIPEVLLWARAQCEERSPNLTKFTEHFNKMSYWARSQILKQEDGKEREKYVIKFIKIMKHLRKINNYNSYLALLSALDSAPIRRLEWHKTIREGLKEYCALIDSSSSFRAYRLALAETSPPCIPYIGLVLQDLTFVHIGNQDYLGEDVINFSKRWQQYNIVVNMKRFKSSAYPYKKNERIIGFFENFENYLDEDAMWQISENIKPRGGRSLQTAK